MAYYYKNGVEMGKLLKAVELIEKKLEKDYLDKVVDCCSQVPAFATFKYKDGSAMYVARDKQWNGEEKRYEYIVQLLGKSDKLADRCEDDYPGDDLIVYHTCRYYESNGKNYRMNGYEVEPLVELAYRMIRAEKCTLIPDDYYRNRK